MVYSEPAIGVGVVTLREDEAKAVSFIFSFYIFASSDWCAVLPVLLEVIDSLPLFSFVNVYE